MTAFIAMIAELAIGIFVWRKTRANSRDKTALRARHGIGGGTIVPWSSVWPKRIVHWASGLFVVLVVLKPVTLIISFIVFGL